MNDPDPADVLVVGSGVAGSLVADVLAGAGARVEVLEAGGRLERSDLVARYRSSWRRDPLSAYPTSQHAPVPDPLAEIPYLVSRGRIPYRVSYLRSAGGTTWHWTGITPRFLPADLEMRTRYGVASDWPVGYAELEPWYVKAERELGVAGDSDDDHGSPRSAPYPMPPIPAPYSDRVLRKRLASLGITVKPLPAARNSVAYGERPACCGNGTCTPICPIGAAYSASVHLARAERAGARIHTDVVVHRLDVGADGNIERVHFRRASGESGSRVARYVVLAANALETAKILLLSKGERAPHGIANRSGQVGRNLMDHPTLGMAFEMPVPLYVGRGPQVVSGIDGERDGPFRGTSAAAKVFISNQFEPHELAVDLIEREKLWAGLEDEIARRAAHYGYLGAEFEMLPAAEHRMSLAFERRDRLGLPGIDVHVDFDDYLLAGARRVEALFERMRRHLGARRLRDDPLGSVWPNHPMGTTIMGDEPRGSVVDRDCRSHDHRNLFVAGAGVFPTGGTANPTLTVAALSLRIGETLRAELVA